jgi:hypothetical protein
LLLRFFATRLPLRSPGAKSTISPPPMTLLTVVIIAIAAFVAESVNSIAGGGT